MALDWSPLVELIRTHQRFLLMTHIRPDCDALGSQFGLAEALKQLGKSVRIVIASNMPPRYRFLDPENVVERFQLPGDSFLDVDAVIILDTGTWNQIGDFGDFLKTIKVPKVVIDHHQTQDNLGAMQFVDTSSEATGRLVYEIHEALGVKLTPTAAMHLFLAVATDTGWFRHPNTSPATFDLVKKFVECGARPTELYEALYERNSPGRMRLIGRALDRLKVEADGKIVYTEVYQTDFPETGSVPSDTEDLINYPRGVEGVEVALVFIEQRETAVKISFRSRSVDVSKVAEQFGGGGHRLASGAITSGTMDDVRQRVMLAVKEVLGE